MGELIAGLNIFDLLFAFFIFYFIITSRNFIFAVIDLSSFILTVIFSYVFYRFFADLLIVNFLLSRGIAKALGFFIAWLIFELIFFIIGRYAISKVPDFIHKNHINRWLAVIPAVIQASVIFFLITVTTFSLPVRAEIKEEMLSSRTGAYFIGFSHLLENRIKNVFGEAANETLNFITIRNAGDEVNLGFKAPANSLKQDLESESIMLDLLNQERIREGLEPLQESFQLRTAAEDYAEEMLINGFFSHESQVDNSSPAERLTRKGIIFLAAGENLAYAPDVYTAHRGLMNSPGHRANILSPDYNQVGVGVIDGGIYGRMFVQEFTN